MTDSVADAGARPAKTYYLPTVVALGAASALAWWSLTQVWVVVAVAAGLSAEVTKTGSQLYPVSLVGAWIGLACVLAILATSGVARRAISVLVSLCAIAVLVAPLAARLGESQVANAWIVTGMAGLLMLGSAVSIWKFSPRWRGLSARQGGSGKSSESMWDALDRGEDPTESGRGS